MIVPSRLLRVALPIMAMLVAHTAFAQTTTTSGGGVSDNSGGITVSFASGDTQFANLSTYDCEHNAPFDFDFAYTWASGQAAEFVLSTSSSCDSPVGASFAGQSACTGTESCPSMLLQNNVTLTTMPSDGMTTDYGSLPLTAAPLTTGGIWSAYTQLAANTSTTQVAPYSNTNSTNTTECGPTGGVDNALLYICALINAGASTTGEVVPYGSLSIALNSAAPDAPGTPTVTPLDSGLSVSWTAVSTAYYYYVHVELADQTADGGAADGGDTDGGDTGDGGVGSDVVSPVSTSSTSASVSGLTNGITYNVYVVSADDSGTDPPTTSNLSGPSPTASGTPVPSYSFFQEYKGHGGTENGCASGGLGGLGAGVVLLVALALLRRRRQRRALTGALVALVVVSGAARVARAADDEDLKPDTAAADAPSGSANTPVGFDDEDNGKPFVRKASPEWFRIDFLLGPYNPNPDQGLPAIPASSSSFPFAVTSNPFKAVFPATNQLLWQLQFFVNFYSGFGHLSAGIGAGYWQTSGHSLLANGSRAGDPETFSLYPITPMLCYRADFIYSLWRVPVVPYVKGGFGFVPFQDEKDGKVTSGTNANGTKWSSEGWAIGPQWAVGIQFPLEFLDEQHAVNLDEDFGINSIGLMGEFGWNYWTGLNGGLPLGSWVASGGAYLAF